LDQAMLMGMFQAFQQMQKRYEDDNDVVGGGKAYRRLHKMKKRIEEYPAEVISEFLADTRLRLGAELHDPWQLWHATERINWGKHVHAKRCHWYLAHGLTYSLRGEHLIAQAYFCQLMRAVHQSSIDGGDWTNACLMMPGHDPCRREAYGVAENDLHVIAAYKDAQRRLERRGPRDDDDEQHGDWPHSGGRDWKDWKDKKKEKGKAGKGGKGGDDK
jgi:hypothetical protein